MLQAESTPPSTIPVTTARSVNWGELWSSGGDSRLCGRRPDSAVTQISAAAPSSVASGCARGDRACVKARVSRCSVTSHLKRLARLGWYWQQASAVNDEVSGSAVAISIGGGRAVCPPAESPLAWVPTTNAASSRPPPEASWHCADGIRMASGWGRVTAGDSKEVGTTFGEAGSVQPGSAHANLDDYARIASRRLRGAVPAASAPR